MEAKSRSAKNAAADTSLPLAAQFGAEFHAELRDDAMRRRN